MPCHAMHCHVFCAIHHNRSCHSWLQRASALPTVQACASPWKTVCIAHCASMCKPVHCTLCTLCKQPRNKYLGSIQLAHQQLNWGEPILQNCARPSKLHGNLCCPRASNSCHILCPTSITPGLVRVFGRQRPTIYMTHTKDQYYL